MKPNTSQNKFPSAYSHREKELRSPAAPICRNTAHTHMKTESRQVEQKAPTAGSASIAQSIIWNQHTSALHKSPASPGEDVIYSVLLAKNTCVEESIIFRIGEKERENVRNESFSLYRDRITSRFGSLQNKLVHDKLFRW